MRELLYRWWTCRCNQNPEYLIGTSPALGKLSHLLINNNRNVKPLLTDTEAESIDSPMRPKFDPSLLRHTLGEFSGLQNACQRERSY